MKNNERNFFIPVNGTLFEVSEDVYRAYYQPIWKTRYHAQTNGECRITKSQLWMCDGICPGCPFHTSEKYISVEAQIGDSDLAVGDTLPDDSPTPESILMDRDLIAALHKELDRLDPEVKRICELIMQGKTEREIAAETGKRQSTVNYQKNRIFSLLREALKDFI
ncbi:MAG: sigma-70 family RNA polymerase sigma factor [Clostridia bacterium]|nr:sigma-70 family RNA polymerase sigma factor [Clostridia bacterium]